MDVFTKLKNTVSNTITNTVHNTAYGLSQLSSVLPGNPVTREFEATAHIASAGPGLLWKIYSGYKKSTKQEAAIFVFEKRLLDRWAGKQERETVLETLKRGVIQLTKLRHPQILIVQHPLEESRDSLAFATEPVFASLANVFGNVENIHQPSSLALRNYKLLDIEIRYGLLQLGEGLAFLHEDVKLLHRNLCPESIVINAHGAWKIFGFDFCALNQSCDAKQPSWSYVEYDPTSSALVQPQLDYQAPECILASSVGPSGDIFSLGMLAYVLHNSNNRPLHESQNDLSSCRGFLETLKTSQISSKLLSIPETLRDTLKLMLSYSPELRPDAHQFIKIEYFMDIGVKTLNYLDKLFQWDNFQKSQFYKGLPQVLKKLPHRVVLHRVLPALYTELVNAPMIPFILPSVLLVTETCEVDEFRDHILPHLKPVLALEEPPQISLVLMQQINLLLKLCPPDVIKNDVVPMLTRALESELEQLQELCLTALPNIVTMIEGPIIKNAILPKIKKICIQSKKYGENSLGIRVNCLLCLAKMLPNFDRWLVFDEILPFLQEIPHTGEPAILMGIIGIYKILLTHSKLGISKEILATKVLPFLIPLCVEQSLSSSQFEALAATVTDMINQVTTEHREALRQLDAVHRETQQLDYALSQAMAENNQMSGPEIATKNLENKTTTKPINLDNGLTIEEKYRLAQQQEVHQRMCQAPLTPKMPSQMVKPQPKDLTESLLKSNLNELNLTMSKATTPQSTHSTLKPCPTTWQNPNVNPGNSGWQHSTHIQPSNFTWQNLNQMHYTNATWQNMGHIQPHVASPQTTSSMILNWKTTESSAATNWNSISHNPVTPNWNSQRISDVTQQNNFNFSTVTTPHILLSQTNVETQGKPSLSNNDIMDLLS